MRLKVILLLNPQVFEQGFLPLKQILQRRDQQRFSKSPGPGQEIILARFDEIKYMPGFVNVDITILPKRSKILYADGVFYHIVKIKKRLDKASFRQFLNNYFGGSAEQLLSYFVKDEDVEPEELEDLLEKIKRKQEESK